MKKFMIMTVGNCVLLFHVLEPGQNIINASRYCQGEEGSAPEYTVLVDRQPSCRTITLPHYTANKQ